MLSSTGSWAGPGRGRRNQRKNAASEQRLSGHFVFDACPEELDRLQFRRLGHRPWPEDGVTTRLQDLVALDRSKADDQLQQKPASVIRASP